MSGLSEAGPTVVMECGHSRNIAGGVARLLADGRIRHTWCDHPTCECHRLVVAEATPMSGLTDALDALIVDTLREKNPLHYEDAADDLTAVLVPFVAARVAAAEQRITEAADGIACPDCYGEGLFGPALRAALARPADEATP